MDWGRISLPGLAKAGADLDNLLNPVDEHHGATGNEPQTLARLALPASMLQKACGSAYCFAGHAVLLAGDTPLVSIERHQRETNVLAGEATMKEVLTPKGQRMTVYDRACELLGLSTEQADVLFDSQNTIEDLLQLVPRLIDGETPQRCRHCARWTWVCPHEGMVCDECECHSEFCRCTSQRR